MLWDQTPLGCRRDIGVGIIQINMGKVTQVGVARASVKLALRVARKSIIEAPLGALGGLPRPWDRRRPWGSPQTLGLATDLGVAAAHGITAAIAAAHGIAATHGIATTHGIAGRHAAHGRRNPWVWSMWGRSCRSGGSVSGPFGVVSGAVLESIWGQAGSPATKHKTVPFVDCVTAGLYACGCHGRTQRTWLLS